MTLFWLELGVLCWLWEGFNVRSGGCWSLETIVFVVFTQRLFVVIIVVVQGPRCSWFEVVEVEQIWSYEQ